MLEGDTGAETQVVLPPDSLRSCCENLLGNSGSTGFAQRTHPAGMSACLYMTGQRSFVIVVTSTNNSSFHQIMAHLHVFVLLRLKLSLTSVWGGLTTAPCGGSVMPISWPISLFLLCVFALPTLRHGHYALFKLSR